MCGICFSLRQRFCRRDAVQRDPTTTTPGSTSVQNTSMVSAPPALSTCTDTAVGSVELNTCDYKEVPLRVVNLHGCRHRYYPPAEPSLFTQVIDNIRRRGPETFGATRRTLDEMHVPAVLASSGEQHTPPDMVAMATEVQGVSAVLGLRGHATVHQPYEMEIETDQDDDEVPHSANKSFLLWNGEIFNGSMCPPPWGSDTVVLASRLAQLEQECMPMCRGDAMDRLSLRQRQELFLSRCVSVFEAEIEGPYGFVFCANRLQMAVFGRDPLGRHSLLVHVSLHDGALNPSDPTTLAEVELLVSSVGIQHARRVNTTPEPEHAGNPVATDPAAAAAASPTCGQKRERGDDDDECGSEPDSAGCCWTELPVTGLFAVPFNVPFFRNADGAAALGHDDDASHCDSSAKGIMMHCPWNNAYHLVHPLLRATVMSEEAQRQAGSTSHQDLAAPSCQHQSSTHTTTKATPPPTELPPLLAEKVAAAAASPTSPDDDERWAHWAAVEYLLALAAAVKRRTDVASSGAEDGRSTQKRSQARRRPLCVLFSGGIDCTVLAALAHYVLPVETPIELVNVAFGKEPQQAPDRVAAMRAVEELLRLPQPDPVTDIGDGSEVVRQREWRLVLVDVPHKISENTPHILDLLTPRHTVMDLDIGTALWYAARGTGRMQVLRHSDVVGETAATNGNGSHVPTGLEGFSKHFRITPEDRGAVTVPSPVSAAPVSDADKFNLLVEVLVAEGRQGGGADKPVLLSTLGKEYGPFLQPHIALHGYKKLGVYLNDACKAGIIRFDPKAPSKAVKLVRDADRERAVADPVCDWFVTQSMRSQGLRTPPEDSCQAQYTSRAKVLLLGMGADETLGGYTRYRRFFQREGMSGAREQLVKDFSRLWQRNLGRDDRITMDSGREPRLPFLDEELLHTLHNIVSMRREYLLQEAAETQQQSSSSTITTPGAQQQQQQQPSFDDIILQRSIEPVMSFRLGAGEGDKRILRRAASIIGLGSVAHLQKRAIQFGSRIAERRVKGSAGL